MDSNSPQIEKILLGSRPLTGDCYKRGHILFKNATNQQSRVLAWIDGFLRTRFAGQDSLSLLSIGAGTGIFDVAFLEKIGDVATKIDYTGIEPNEKQAPLLKENIAAVLPAGSHSDIHTCLFEDFSAEGKKYDVILSVHAHYFFSDIAELLTRAADHLEKDGIFVLTSAGDSFLSKYFVTTFQKNFGHPAWLSSDIEKVLQAQNIAYQKHRIDAELDLSPCFSPDRSKAVDMLNYIVHADISQMSEEDMELLKDELRRNMFDKNSQKIAHPVDAFIITGQRA